MSHQLERGVQSSRYFAPIVAGTGQGGLLADAFSAQAPENTVAGAVSRSTPSSSSTRVSIRARPTRRSRTTRRAGLRRTGGALQAGRIAGRRVACADRAASAVASAHEEDVSDLPLIELRAARPNDLLAIVISGDGGWRDLDKTMAEAMQREGVSVIGIDALRYFWSEKTPQQIAPRPRRA